MVGIMKNKKKSELLAEYIQTLHYGDIITHEQIAGSIDVQYKSNQYATLISQTRKILQQHGIFLEIIKGNGYRVVEPDNVVNESLKHYKRGFTAMQKGYDTLNYAPTKDMTPEGREIYRRVHDKAITLTASMKGATVELKMLGNKKHPMCVENIHMN